MRHIYQPADWINIVAFSTSLHYSEVNIRLRGETVKQSISLWTEESTTKPAALRGSERETDKLATLHS